jgi:hypothetical protein
MAYIPRNARWYIAQIVERIKVQGDPRAVVHVNFCLVEATGPAIAYRNALARGKAAEMTYLNPKGRKVSIEFLGLRQLNVVYERLEHGAELLYDCNYPVPSGACTGTANIAPVGTTKLGAGAWGQLDLAGDLWVWTLDTYDDYVSPCVDCVSISTASSRFDSVGVSRGGVFEGPAGYLESTFRGGGSGPPLPVSGTGVRCARAP